MTPFIQTGYEQMFLKSLPVDALAPIRARFLVALRDREQRLREVTVAAALVHAPECMAEDLHKIRGVAPMLDLPDLGALAAVAEDRFDTWQGVAGCGQGDRLPDDLLDCLRALSAAMTRALDTA